MSTRTEEILSWYRGQPPGVLVNLSRLLRHGRLKDTGRLLVLPVDQGFEHGPARSFAKEPSGYDPRTHLKLAHAAGLSAHAAPLGALEACSDTLVGQVPLILKLNNADTLSTGGPHCSAQTATVTDALRLGCTAIGLTLYPGSDARNSMYEQTRELISEARAVGLPTVIWAYPRGGTLTGKGETAIDVVAYAAHLACQLGAHIVKVKPPSDWVEQSAAQKVYSQNSIAIATLAERVRHVMQAAFANRRLVLFSGGSAKQSAHVLAEVDALIAGGASGCIMGRNIFQRSPQEAHALLDALIERLAAP